MRIIPSQTPILRLSLPFLILFLPATLLGQTFGGIGSRAEGMGGAFVAVADDATAVYWNPAGLATGAVFDAQVFTAGGDLPFFVGTAFPALGLSYYRTEQPTASAVALPTVPDSAGRQDEGLGVVPFRLLKTNNFGVTILQSIVSGAVVGSTVRVVNGGIEGVDGRTTVDVDAGFMLSVKSIRAGVSARNLAEPEFDDELGRQVPIQRQVRVGVALAPRAAPSGVHGPLSIAFDADIMTTSDDFGDRRGAAIGGEYWLARGLIGARAGMRWSTLESGHRAFSGGATVRLPKSLYVDAHVTDAEDSEDTVWGISGRLTF